ncbi:MAG TPA: cob(I)yrinic acid a,c-diamide adenosyltransferase [Balneolaceae bacterium]|nr:cob(I)yrinic acid a,c-diamide adenosyltransferase [Balneolaceae bacterium]
MMKIYTKKGDKGQTALFGGAKVGKEDIRLHAYGTTDELNSLLGMILAQNVSNTTRKILLTIQEELFVLGSDLATPLPKKGAIDRLQESQVKRLEILIDKLEHDLPPLTSFILPGGSPAGATLHFARTVCRRAERYTAGLMQKEEINEQTLIYLNRLSDLLFVLARFENQQAAIPETAWQPRKKEKPSG